MNYTEIAGRSVSAMSLGTVQLGMNYGIANREGKPDREKCHSILSAAVDSGITALDTARAYGDSEEVIGEFLKKNPGLKDRLFITTKLSSGLPAGSADVERSLFRSMETSLWKLGLSKVNCLLLHNASDLTHGRTVSETLRRLVSAGMADIAGVSVYHPEEADMLHDDVYRVVQVPVNVFDQRFIKTGALDRLHRRGIKIFARSVFFQGLFFLDPENIADPDLRRFAVPHLIKLNQLSAEAGMSISRFAAAFLLGIPGIASLVLGADNPGQVTENLSLFENNCLDEKTLHLAKNSFDDIDYAGIMSVLSRPKKEAQSA